MTTFVALLRGINVGGRNKLAMNDLRALCEELGFAGVRTYIQSGNVVLNTSLRSSAAVESRIEGAIREQTGLDVSVVARTSKDLAKTIAANPFTAASIDHRYLLVVFPKARPTKTLIDVSAYGPEQLVVEGSDVFVYYPNGVGRSKLTNAVLERLLGGPATARNWNTVNKLLALAGG
jgi:uncharacterized protein (DUF1697 family)